VRIIAQSFFGLSSQCFLTTPVARATVVHWSLPF
jgi:hypothetical protein